MLHWNIANLSEQTANVKAVATVSLAAVSWLADLNLMLQLAATAAAVAVGISATLWNIEKYRAARRERLSEDQKDDSK